MTLGKINTKIAAFGKSIDSKIDKLAEMTMNGFRETATKSDLTELEQRMNKRFEETDQKIDYRYNALANRIDDLAMNRTTRLEHAVLTKRVSRIEKKFDIA